MPFPTTRWSVVLTAADQTDGPRRALHELCADYWPPLFAYLRRTGMSVADAEDTVQGFLATLLDGPAIAGVDRERGRFRGYLLGALRNYLSTQRKRAGALKRGGGQQLVSLDGEAADRELQVPDDRTPEGAYAYAWAMSILSRTETRVAEYYAKKGKAPLFDALQPSLLSGETPAYAELATALGITEGAARVAAHRVRARFGILLREEVAHTVANENAVDEELRALLKTIL